MLEKYTQAFCAEYVWIGANGDLRSKTKVICRKCPETKAEWEEVGTQEFDKVTDFPEWNFDGSSTNQASGNDSEVIIKPCAVFDDPLRGDSKWPHRSHKLILCDTYYPDQIRPLESNKRSWAKQIFDKKLDEKPWFGLEQEYYIYNFNDQRLPIGHPDDLPHNSLSSATGDQGQYYCGSGAQNAFGRKIAEEHLQACIKAGIKISGINAEVGPGQWEFQIGPCTGIDAGDHLWMARYLLNRIGEKHNMTINYHPKPFTRPEWNDCAPDWNGSGCHTNYSTLQMRTYNNDLPGNGLKCIKEAISKLSKNHTEHMKVYGADNEKRMTGKCETASYDKFSDGIGDRSASVRIGNKTVSDGYGYFEDRRPSSNCDPYLVTAKIFETTVLNT
tara:strand:+ start:310 stop:1470 length:1161 start_codon:yes stop_codon:yes gene_type:complete